MVGDQGDPSTSSDKGAGAGVGGASGASVRTGSISSTAHRDGTGTGVESGEGCPGHEGRREDRDPGRTLSPKDLLRALPSLLRGGGVGPKDGRTESRDSGGEDTVCHTKWTSR